MEEADEPAARQGNPVQYKCTSHLEAVSKDRQTTQPLDCIAKGANVYRDAVLENLAENV
jgi:hypothetical protein